MRRELPRSSGTGAHGLGTRGWKIRACSAGRGAVCGGVQLLPCWPSWRRWQQPFPRCFDKMENERTRGKGWKCQQRIVPKQVKGNIFRIRAVKYLSLLRRKVQWSLNYLAQNPTGHNPKEPIINNSLLSAGYWSSWPQDQWKLSSDSDSVFAEEHSVK